MRIVTTCHKAGYDKYGQEFTHGLKFFPEHELYFYAEGFDYPDGKRVEDLPKLEAFKEKHKNYRPNSYQWDVVRYANKVYAMHDAAYDCDDLIVGIDADCAAYAQIPDGYIESLLPQGCFLAFFRRKGIYPELGMWLMDGSHPEKQSFLNTWLSWYETGMFKDLRQWHDGETFDATVKLFLRRERFKIHSLSGEFEKHMHPMSQVDLGRYLDHRKGARKELPKSPENAFR